MEIAHALSLATVKRFNAKWIDGRRVKYHSKQDSTVTRPLEILFEVDAVEHESKDKAVWTKNLERSLEQLNITFYPCFNVTCMDEDLSDNFEQAFSQSLSFTVPIKSGKDGDIFFGRLYGEDRAKAVISLEVNSPASSIGIDHAYIAGRVDVCFSFSRNEVAKFDQVNLFDRFIKEASGYMVSYISRAINDAWLVPALQKMFSEFCSEDSNVIVEAVSNKAERIKAVKLSSLKAERIGPIMDALELDVLSKNVVLAGGSLRTLFDHKDKVVDYDIFVLGKENHRAVKSKLHDMAVFDGFKVLHSSDAMVSLLDTQTDRKYQFVFDERYTEIESVFLNFDFDCCKIVCDGEYIYFTNTAVTSIKKKILTMERIPFAPIASFARLRKYEIKGYNIVPAMDKLMEHLKNSYDELSQKQKTTLIGPYEEQKEDAA